MSPEQGFTVSPVVTETDSGEVVTDFSVSQTAYLDSRGWEDDFVMDSEGQYRHIMQDVELEDESSPMSFNEGDYIDAIYESNPQLNAAIEWGGENLTQPELDSYNRAVESGSLDELNEAVQWILNRYEQEGFAPPQTTTDEVEEQSGEGESLLDSDTIERVESLSDDEADYLTDVVDTLASNEPAGAEYAEQWENYAVQAEDAGDTCASFVAAMTAQYHAGSISAEEAIATAMNNFDLKDLQRVYAQFNQ